METRAEETGCLFTEHGQQCHKLIESGTLMCPHHNLLTAHREQQKEERRKKAATPAKKPVRSQSDRHTQKNYYSD